jgi:four helix bundle protein
MSVCQPFRIFSAFQRFSFSSLMSRLSEDLRGRTKRCASDVIRLFCALPKGRDEVRILGKQLLRSGTSVAAHSREASRARSDGEFCSKLDGLLQEADESQLWLELLRDDCGIQNEQINKLLQETGELMAIFTTMVAKLRKSGS